MSNHHPITIGEIDYANAWPLFKGFQGHAKGINYKMVSRVPSELNRMLSSGELDVSAISSFSYGQYSSDYVLLPELSVGSIGKVHSILLFLKQPLHVKAPKHIAVSTASETSINLLKIIMSKRFGMEPQYIRAAPNLEQMLEAADAALLIGDPAIAASWQSEGLYVLDLGELWNDWTGLGMTYAVVAARRSAAAAYGDELQAVYAALQQSKRDNLAHIEGLVSRACSGIGGTPAYWQQYFLSLQYDFGEKLRGGLSLYFKYARELDLLSHEAELTFYEDQSLQKVKE